MRGWVIKRAVLGVLVFVVYMIGLYSFRSGFAVTDWLTLGTIAGCYLSLVGVEFVLMSIKARRVTGHSSPALLWRFWERDESYRYMSLKCQKSLFEELFGSLGPGEVDACLRGDH